MTRPIGNPASSKKSVPDAPPSLVGANNGTDRAFNNGRIDVTVTAPTFDGKLPISQYTITPNPATIPPTFSNTTPIVSATGLSSATPYTFTAVATNAVGNSATSIASLSTTATTVPQVPSSVTAATYRFSAYGSAPYASITLVNGADGGSTRLNHEYSTDSGSTYISAGSLGLSGGTFAVNKQSNNTDFVAGTSYAFLFRTRNANGVSTSFSTSPALVATVPQAPSITGGNRVSNTQVSISFALNNNGGSSLTGLTFSASPAVANLQYPVQFSSPITLTGTFALNQPYTFTMTSTNFPGTSLSSNSSPSITPNVSAPPVTPPPVTPPPVTPPPVTPPVTPPTTPPVTPPVTPPTTPPTTPPVTPPTTPPTTPPVTPPVTPPTTPPTSCVPNQGEFCEVTYSCGACNCCPYPCYRPGRINCFGGCTLSGGFYC
jgi:hypothetical protein